YFMCSPFTNEKTPSFCVNPVQQYFKDFSSGKSGNVLTYIMEVNGMDFISAVKELAKYKGIEVEYESEEFAKKHKERMEKITSLRPILNASLKKYRELLMDLERDHPAWNELEKRKYDKDLIIDWQIGFAPGSKFIYNNCVEAGVKEPAKELGLISDTNDKYWNRLIYPIHDENDQLVGLAGRDLSGKKEMAKWINPVDSTLYNKDQILFGLNKAKKEIAKSGNAWLVEGYNDVIAWHRYGIVNTVAPCGTSITNNQIQKLKKIARKVTLCFDSDAAGIKSMLKYIPAIIEAGMSVEVCQLPAGENGSSDPDEFVRNFEKELVDNELIYLVQPYITDGFKFFMDHNLQGSETDRIHGVQLIAKTITNVSDSFLKDTYISWLAKESKFSKKMIQEAVNVAEIQEVKTMNFEDTTAWPKGLPNEMRKEFTDMVQRYGLFQWSHRIRKSIKSGFVTISNFEIRIIPRMSDEKFPKKLVQIKNTA